MTDPTPRTTPLHSRHLALGAKMAPFAGFDMPIQYAGIVAEHAAVRERAGLFDVSHMGEFRIRGPQALDLAQRLVTNDVSKLEDGRALYAVLCHASGGAVDDLLVYRLAEDDVMLVVNASNIGKDWAHVAAVAADAGLDARLADESDEWALLALQGPEAFAVFERATGLDVSDIPFYHVRQPDAGTVFGAERALVSHTGYTGERGLEIYLEPGAAGRAWDALVEAGATPAGLGARDTLRLEAGYCLYGNELDDETTPLEAGLGWVVKPDAGDFVGRDALVAQKEAGVPRKLVGLVVEGRGIPRAGYPITDGVADGAEEIGAVTSGSQSPTLGAGGRARVRPQRGAVHGAREHAGRVGPGPRAPGRGHEAPVPHGPAVMDLDVALSPLALDGEALRGRTVVVVDVLRASSTVVTALANGARAVIPVAEQGEAGRLAASLDADVSLLGGERGGQRLAGFGAGNSPREYTREAVAGRTVVLTTLERDPGHVARAGGRRGGRRVLPQRLGGDGLPQDGPGRRPAGHRLVRRVRRAGRARGHALRRAPRRGRGVGGRGRPARGRGPDGVRALAREPGPARAGAVWGRAHAAAHRARLRRRCDVLRADRRARGPPRPPRQPAGPGRGRSGGRGVAGCRLAGAAASGEAEQGGGRIGAAGARGWRLRCTQNKVGSPYGAVGGRAVPSAPSAPAPPAC